MGILCKSASRDGSVCQRTDGSSLWIGWAGGSRYVWRSSADHGSESGGHEKPLSVPDKICDVEQLRHEEKRQKHCRLPDGSGSV